MAEDRKRRFGWCMEGHHDRCRVSYVAAETSKSATKGETITCECDCHQQKTDQKPKFERRKRK